MTPERWRQVSEIFHAALERDGDGRGAYLDEVCAADRALRSEVDALLAAHRDAGEFGEAPLFAPSLDDAPEPLAPPPAPARRWHPFLFFVGLAAAASLAVFAHAAWLLLDSRGATTNAGWTERYDSGEWFVRSVDPSGPAAGRLAPGDRVVAMSGVPPVLDAGTLLLRRQLSPGDEFDLVVERDGARRTHTLRAAPGPPDLPTQLTYFLVSLVWCVVGLWIGLARPDERVPRLACVTALSAGWVFLQVGVVESGPLWQPLHMVLGYHFFTRFPSGKPPGMFWRAALWLMYTTGAIPAVAGVLLHATVLATGVAGVLALVTSFPGAFALRFPLLMVSGGLAAVGMVAIIPFSYRRLSDEDQRRRVRWLLFGSFVGLVPQLWWSAVGLFDLTFGPSGVSQASVVVNAFTAAVPISVAYAVIVHRVFDIRVVIRRGLQYLLARRVLQALVALPLAALVYTLVVDRHRTIAELAAEESGYLYWTAAAALALAFRRPIQSWLDRRFFREELDREQMLLGLVDDLGRVDSIARLSELVCAKLELALHPRAIHLWYRDPGELAAASSSNPELAPADFPAEQRWLSWLEERGAMAELPLPSGARVSPSGSRWLAARGVSLVVPLADGADRLAGVLLLGAKKSEEPYTATDRRLLEAIAKQAAVVRENLQLRAQVTHEQRIRHDVLARFDGTLELLKECPACGACFDAPAERCDRDGHVLTLSLPVARTIDGKYRLDRRIGRGGMGAVYEARDLRLERPVAVKILSGRAFGEPAALRRFRREARATAQLNHPHIVAVHDYGPLEGEGAYLVMELVDGATLRAELERVGSLAPAEAADWFDPLLAGLSAAHAQGIVHRDLKPENVIGWRDDAGRLGVKVLDFGLAKLGEADAGAGATMTARGVVMGTFGYMSPEQLTGGDVDARSDLFALGVMLAEVLTGRRPFEGESAREITRAVQNDAFHLPLASAQARALDALLQRCLEKDARRRLASASELRAELIPLLRACPPLVV